MSQSPLNLAFRFTLEMAALYSIGYWGWTRHDGPWRYLLAFGLPVVAAALWGTFRVPGDGGAPRVRVSGVVRLLLEAMFFGAAAWGLFDAGAVRTGLLFSGLVLFHYIISYDRIGWLLRQ
jgi:hypothetical protein